MPRKPKNLAIKWSKPFYNKCATLHFLKVSFVPSSLKSFYLRTFLYALLWDILQHHHRTLIFKCTKFLQIFNIFFSRFNFEAWIEKYIYNGSIFIFMVSSTLLGVICIIHRTNGIWYIQTYYINTEV